MKTRFLIIGISMLVFGFANFFRYLSISHSPTFLNKPFPFEHIYNVIPHDGGGGASYQMAYLPLEIAVHDPYWVLWSLILYAGIATTSFAIVRRK